jgi:chromate transporter
MNLIALAGQFAILSLLAFGGGNAMLPEIQRVAVDSHHWVSQETFGHLFAIAQASPGPNIMVVTLIGWQVAGLAGALTATLAFCLPSSLLIYQLAAMWSRLRDERWRDAIHSGMAPIAVGLVISGGLLMARGADSGWHGIALTALATLFPLVSRRNPLWLIATGAAVGLIGWV